uniref:MYND-type domain-containing protein n=1 Tax=Octactis speculum TaxID=3111310 RepID=A0A7S2HNZ5_9STRA
MCPHVEQFKERSRCCSACGAKPSPPPAKAFPICSKCRMVSFCNASCLKAGWKEHKKVCTSREQRVEALIDALFTSPVTRPNPGADSFSLSVKYSAAAPVALDATGERVNGALLLIINCSLLVDLGGSGVGEELIVPAIRHMCGMRVTSSDVGKVCDALGLRNELDIARKANLADFQRVEKGLVELRAKVETFWPTLRILREGQFPGLQKGIGLAKAAIETRGDKGVAVRDFLVFATYEGVAVTSDDTAIAKAITAAQERLNKLWVGYLMVDEGERNVLLLAASGLSIEEQTKDTRNLASLRYHNQDK